MLLIYQTNSLHRAQKTDGVLMEQPSQSGNSREQDRSETEAAKGLTSSCAAKKESVKPEMRCTPTGVNSIRELSDPPMNITLAMQREKTDEENSRKHLTGDVE